MFLICFHSGFTHVVGGFSSLDSSGISFGCLGLGLAGMVIIGSCILICVVVRVGMAGDRLFVFGVCTLDVLGILCCVRLVLLVCICAMHCHSGDKFSS